MKSSPPLRTPHGTWARSATEKAHAFSQHLASLRISTLPLWSHTCGRKKLFLNS
jgi:hypothetical protein